MAKGNDKQIKCSFCGKSQEQVRRLIAGPDVYICDECIELCHNIVDEEIDIFEDYDFTELPKPKEIKDRSEAHTSELQSQSRISRMPSSA